MSMKVKVEFELDIEKIAKSSLVEQFGTAVSSIKVIVPDATPVRKKPIARNTTAKATPTKASTQTKKK